MDGKVKSKNSIRFVIDASLARAAGGEESLHPVSVNCRKFLQDILSICHRIVFNKEIETEWNKHASNFSRKWRVAMESKGKIIPVNSGGHANLRNKTLSENTRDDFSENDKNAILKDFILIEAALETDKIIVSLDTTAERVCNNLKNIIMLQTIKWTKPESSILLP